MIKGIIPTPLIEGETVVIYSFSQSSPKKNGLSQRKNWQKRLGFLSLVLALTSFLLFLSPFLLSPKIVEKNNSTFKPIIAREIKPKTKNFLLSIDKIGLHRAKVIPQVNPEDRGEYEPALKKGIAQAKGTAFPGQGKMVYIFGHSTNYPWFVKDLNALFFKLETLSKGDKIEIEYNGQIFNYYVFQKKVVKSSEVKVIKENLGKDILVLQTCYPPGTFWKRLLIFARPSKFSNLI